MNPEKVSPCAGVLRDSNRAERRLNDALSAFANLREYRELMSKLGRMEPEARSSCAGLGAAVADRAFDAEANGRILIGHALDSLNDLRDEGRFYDAIGEVARDLAGDGAKDFSAKLQKESGPARERFGDGAGDLLDEAAKATEALGLRFSVQRGALLINRKNGPHGEDHLRLGTTQQLGQAGRVSSSEFFGGTKAGGFATPPSLYTPVDCHHRPLRDPRDVAITADPYAAAVGGLATLKGLLYQHARRVDELGPRGLRGEDPLTAILVVIAVVGAGLIVYGIATQDYGVAAFGAFLIVGAAFVAFGGFTLVLAVVA